MRLLRAKKKPPQIIQGMTLRTLWKVLANNEFQVDPSCYPRLAYLLILGVFNSLYGCCETYFNAEEIEQVKIEKSPIFVDRPLA